MTVTPDRLDLPARRRRHARLIAAMTELIGACAEAGGAVYWPIAAASPDQEAVAVTFLPCVQVSLGAAALLDLARAEDDARWPTAVAWEREEARTPRGALWWRPRSSQSRPARLVSTACRCRRWSSPPRWSW
ncbi:hypothetical protein ACFY2W_29335 [Streptomyces sp. NPDC001262]|uniref:hypothetical protein n=1 Tax=Streptomyces sp. NPDC001262 TaxID=3364552 RepID=UPI0036BB52BA